VAILLEPRVRPEASIGGVGDTEAELYIITQKIEEELPCYRLGEAGRAWNSPSDCLDRPDDRRCARYAQRGRGARPMPESTYKAKDEAARQYPESDSDSGDNRGGE
jgi:hypothetical protein